MSHKESAADCMLAGQSTLDGIDGMDRAGLGTALLNLCASSAVRS